MTRTMEDADNSKSLSSQAQHKLVLLVWSYKIFERQTLKVGYKQPNINFVWHEVFREETKFFHLATKLPEKINEALRDILVDEYSSGMYIKLRAIIARFTASPAERLKQLLDDETIGSRKPNQFLRDLITDAGNQVTRNIIVHRWLTQLPKIVMVSIRPFLGPNQWNRSRTNNETCWRSFCFNFGGIKCKCYQSIQRSQEKQ